MVRRRRGVWVVAVLIAAIGAAALAVAIGPGLTLVQTSLYDNRPSGVACDDLPARADVEAALADHADLVRRIEALDAAVDVLMSEPCDGRPGAAEVLVIYPGGDLRERIADLLADETFGVPVTLRNV